MTVAARATDAAFRTAADAALARLRATDPDAAAQVPQYIALQSTWPEGTSYNRVPGSIEAILAPIRTRGGSALVAEFHRTILLCAMAATRPLLGAHPAWSESLPLWDDAMLELQRDLPTRAESDLDYPSDAWAKDIALASGRVWHGKAQLVEPRMGIGRRAFLGGGLKTALQGGVFLLKAGHFPYYEIHTAAQTLRHFNPQGWTDCYAMIARALARDASAKGVVGTAWFFDPAMRTVSPRLEYLRSFPLERGALFFRVATSEAARLSAISKSESRRRMFDAGEYVPQEYLMIWPRKALLSWVAAGAR